MSGHSKWATIHRQKGVKDAARGNLFSKLAQAITIAVKTGGGPNLDSNFKLRVAVDKARQANMPKDNIERAISKGSGGEALTEIVYEGFGPAGVSVIVEAATDNKNRTSQEIKGLFERGGGRMGGPGAVSFNFENKGLLVVKKEADVEEEMLKLIDLGVEDIEETEDGIEVYVAPESLTETKKNLEDAGFTISTTELYMKPKTTQNISDSKEAEKVLAFLDALSQHDDVQKVFANLNISDDTMDKLEK